MNKISDFLQTIAYDNLVRKQKILPPDYNNYIKLYRTSCSYNNFINNLRTNDIKICKYISDNRRWVSTLQLELNIIDVIVINKHYDFVKYYMCKCDVVHYERAIHMSIITGDMDMLQLLLSDDVILNDSKLKSNYEKQCKRNNSNRRFKTAVINHKFDIAQYLLCDELMIDEEIYHHLVTTNNIDIIKKLDVDYNLLLRIAVERNNMSVIEMINDHLKKNYYDTVRYALTYGNLDAFKLFIRLGYIDVIKENINMVFHDAVFSTNKELVRYIYDSDEIGFDSLWLSGYIDVCRTYASYIPELKDMYLFLMDMDE